MDLVSILIVLLVVAVILYVVNLILGQLHIPPPLINIIWLIIAIIVILCLLKFLGLLPGPLRV